MSKLAQSFVKYLIRAKIRTSSAIERPDVIGAIFGQTEGLLGTELDLRELQKTGRIGRIEVNLKTKNGESFGEITIPSSLDLTETTLIAAALETVDKVGPCEAKIIISEIEDVRTQKRRYIIERAKELLRKTLEKELPDMQKLIDNITQSLRTYEIIDYHGLSAGKDIENYDEIVVVEGRADVINLIKNGIKNVIGIEGTKIPEPIIMLSKEKEITAFLDGDRGGDLILKKLVAVADIDYVARAPRGKEVEELTKKEIYKALREREPIAEALEKIKDVKIEDYEKGEEKVDKNFESMLIKLLSDIMGSRAAVLVNNNKEIIQKLPLAELSAVLDMQPDVFAIIIDGKINQTLVDLAIMKKVKYLVGTGYKEKVKIGRGLKVLTQK